MEAVGLVGRRGGVLQPKCVPCPFDARITPGSAWPHTVVWVCGRGRAGPEPGVPGARPPHTPTHGVFHSLMIGRVPKRAKRITVQIHPDEGGPCPAGPRRVMRFGRRVGSLHPRGLGQPPLRRKEPGASPVWTTPEGSVNHPKRWSQPLSGRWIFLRVGGSNPRWPCPDHPLGWSEPPVSLVVTRVLAFGLSPFRRSEPRWSGSGYPQGWWSPSFRRWQPSPLWSGPPLGVLPATGEGGG